AVWTKNTGDDAAAVSNHIFFKVNSEENPHRNTKLTGKMTAEIQADGLARCSASINGEKSLGEITLTGQLLRLVREEEGFIVYMDNLKQSGVILIANETRNMVLPPFNTRLLPPGDYACLLNAESEQLPNTPQYLDLAYFTIEDNGCISEEFDNEESGLAQWSHQAVGSSEKGLAGATGGRLQISSAEAGDEIWEEDRFDYVYQQVNGDFRVEADIIDIGAGATAGLMVRSGLAADGRDRRVAINAFLLTESDTPQEYALQFIFRGQDGGAGNERVTAAAKVIGLPIRVAIDKHGDSYGVFYLKDGSNVWEGGVRVEIDMGDTLLAGASAVSGIATFDNLSICSSSAVTPQSCTGKEDFGRPDLEIEDISVTGPGNETGYPQTLMMSGTVNVTIKNSGIQLAKPDAAGYTGLTALAFYDVNLNGVYDHADIMLGIGRNVGTEDFSLKAGESTDIEIAIAAEELQSPFRDAPISVWVDSGQVIKEENEKNNTGTSAAYMCKTAEKSIEAFESVQKWKWPIDNTVIAEPGHTQVISMPIVAALEDTNGDGKITHLDTPAVIFHTYKNAEEGAEEPGYSKDGVLRAVSGKDGTKLWDVTKEKYRTLPAGSLAAADIDHDGIVEIIAPKPGGGVFAFEHTGEFKWESSVSPFVKWGGASIADLDGDNTPEIVIGSTVLNADGSLRWQRGGFTGSGNSRPLSIVEDINLDGKPEIIAGAAAYSSAGKILWQNEAVGDGFTALANFNNDPYPEIVVVSGGRIHLLDHKGMNLGNIAPTGIERGGPPVIGDVDGDGITMEIGVAGAERYVVLKPEYDNSDNSWSIHELWSRDTQDADSFPTASSMFDFDGDGKAEVIYADNKMLHIYSDAESRQAAEDNTNAITYEYPVIADVDNDGSANIVFFANSSDNDPDGQSGIRVYESANNAWVDTRKIWNQHSYHVTNINDDGTAPAFERNSWQVHNSYRSGNIAGFPDLTAGRVVVIDKGVDNPVSIQVRIGNAGSARSPAGILVTFRAVDMADPEKNIIDGWSPLPVTLDVLEPGAYRDIRLDDSDAAALYDLIAKNQVGISVEVDGTANECGSDNNTVILDISKPEDVVVPYGTVNIDKITADASGSGNTVVIIEYSVKNKGRLPGKFRGELYMETANSDGTQGDTIKILEIPEINLAAGETASSLSVEWNISGAVLSDHYQARAILYAVGEDFPLAEMLHDPFSIDLMLTEVNKDEMSIDPHTLQASGSVTVSVKNTGSVPISASGGIDLLLFYDENLDGIYNAATDIKLGQGRISDSFEKEKGVNVQIVIDGAAEGEQKPQLPFRDAPLTVWADSSRKLAETDEKNNVKTAAGICAIPPRIGTFEPVLKWAWNGTDEYNQVASIPLVLPLDTNEDGKVDDADEPAIVFHSGNILDDGMPTEGVLHILSGKDGTELWPDTYRKGTNPIGTLAAADIDNDGEVEIIAPRLSLSEEKEKQGGLIIFKYNKEVTWEITQAEDISIPILTGGAAIAGFDGEDDKFPEIIVGNMVLQNIGEPEPVFRNAVSNMEGKLRWPWKEGFIGGVIIKNTIKPAFSTRAASSGESGTPISIIGTLAYSDAGEIVWRAWEGVTYERIGIAGQETTIAAFPVVADINNDGKPEVIAGAMAYSTTGEILWRNDDAGDGFTAVGDFDKDSVEPKPEIVVVSQGKVHLLDSVKGEVRWSVDIPGGGFGGFPVIADMDGDGVPEIGVAGKSKYVVFKEKEKGDDGTELCDTALCGTVLWSADTQDYSSHMTGSSVFDFDGDGKVEVVYADEHFLRVYRGETGEVVFKIPNESATLYEYPVIADVDGDDHAEIVVCSNYADEDYRHKAGIRVYGGKYDTWANTRKIWNQHSYHINNINDDGTAPAIKENSWETHNTYRMNALSAQHGAGIIDLSAARLRIIDQGGGLFKIQARIGNGGAASLPKNTDVAFWVGKSAKPGDAAIKGVLDNALDDSFDAGDSLDVSQKDIPFEGVLSSIDDTVNVLVDSKYAVGECNEGNNQFSALAGEIIVPHGIVEITEDIAVDASGTINIPYEVTNDSHFDLYKVTNDSHFDLSNPAKFYVQLRIEDKHGNTIERLEEPSFSLAKDGKNSVTGEWKPESALPPGNYRVHAVLYARDVADDSYYEVAEKDEQPFSIEVPGLDVKTDSVTPAPSPSGEPEQSKAVTSQGEQTDVAVLVGYTLQNNTPDISYEGVRLIWRIKNSDGLLIYEDIRKIGQAVPGYKETQHILYNVPLTGAGIYHISVRAEDGGGSFLDSDQTEFSVESNLTVTGMLQTDKTQLEAGEAQICTAALTNRDTMPVNGLLVQRMLADMGTADLTDSKEEFVDLTSKGSALLGRDFSILPLSPAEYICVLRIKQGEAWQVLDMDGFTVTGASCSPDALPDAADGDVRALSLDSAAAKQVYHTSAIALVSHTVQNIHASVVTGEGTLTMEVRDPEGRLVYSGSRHIPQLQAGAAKNLLTPFMLEQAPEGMYTAVIHAEGEGSLPACRQIQFRVEHDPSIELSAQVQVLHPQLSRGETQSCEAVLNNENGDLPALPVRYLLASLDTLETIPGEILMQDIAAGTQWQVPPLSFDTAPLLPGDYACALQIGPGGIWTLLGFSGFTLDGAPPPATETCHAAEAVDYTPGWAVTALEPLTLDTLPLERQNTANVLGAPVGIAQEDTVSLGLGGALTLKLDGGVYDGSGYELYIAGTADTADCAALPKVQLSQYGIAWHTPPQDFCADNGYIDLQGLLPWSRYLRIFDGTEEEDIAHFQSLGVMADGYDADGIRCAGDETPPRPVCHMYAVHNSAKADSRILTLNPATGQIHSLGPQYPDAGLEGMDFDPHTRKLYASSTGDNKNGSELFSIAPETGVRNSAGIIRDAEGAPFQDIAALAFHPADGSLWGFARKGKKDRRGILSINAKTAVAVMEKTSNLNIDGLAWSVNGDTLWLLKNKHLYTYSEGVITQSHTLAGLAGNIKGLETYPDGSLMAGSYHGHALNIYKISETDGALLHTDRFDTGEYNDIDALAWPEWCGKLIQPPVN
ncbi:MAG: hypothetical protein GY862_16615, partial [Gammaproteobacteria bacterium]|nr:hypothetical protein [Gammaproteobacteria bacterium]